MSDCHIDYYTHRLVMNSLPSQLVLGWVPRGGSSWVPRGAKLPLGISLALAIYSETQERK